MRIIDDEAWLFEFCEAFFQKEGRDPTDEEIETAAQEAEDAALALAEDLDEAESTGN